MKDTKKLTMGAMLLAIVGAVMVLNQLFGYLLDELLFLMYAVCIIIYATKYTLKDGFILAFGIVIITLLLGSVYSYIYMPLGIIAGLAYVYGIKHDLDRGRLLIMEMIIFIIGELLITLLVLPLFGVNFYEEVVIMLDAVKETLNSAGVLGLIEDTLDNMILVIAIFSIMFMGLMEGILIHLLATYLLKRFKIKEVKIMHLYALRIPPLLAYLAMACCFLFFTVNYFKTQPFLLYTAITLALLGAMVLVAMGYIFFMVYGSIVLGRNIGLYIFLLAFILFPYSLIVLMIVGFLYGSGPLRIYIERKSKGA